MQRISPEANQKGFTLIEMMAVLVILGVLVSVTIKKYGEIGDTAASRGLQAGVSELNARETLVWAKHMFADRGFKDDATVWAEMDKNIGSAYSWTAGPDRLLGGTLLFRWKSTELDRDEATATTAARWHL